MLCYTSKPLLHAHKHAQRIDFPSQGNVIKIHEAGSLSGVACFVKQVGYLFYIKQLEIIVFLVSKQS